MGETILKHKLQIKFINFIIIVPSTLGMSQKSKEIFDFFPPVQNIPQIYQTLKMINTVNVFPANSTENIQMPQFMRPPFNDYDSYADLQSIIQPINNSSKKKKIGCTCKKTFCLKMYCQCYSSSRKCSEDCACISCKNTVQFKQEPPTLQNTNKKVSKRKCSLAQKRCNCKKSHCLKRYCECFNQGVGCSQLCKCEGCQNKDISCLPRSDNQLLESFQKIQGDYIKQEIKGIVDLQKFQSCVNDMDKFFT